jgi:mono/diheme cytochrome c family protein
MAAGRAQSKTDRHALERAQAGNLRTLTMKNMIRSTFVLAAIISVAGAMSFAQDGGAIYKSKCAACHGAAGTPSAGMAKMMGIKATSDPAISGLSADQVAATVKNGKGKMKPIAGLSDDEVKAVSAFFKTLK